MNNLFEKKLRELFDSYFSDKPILLKNACEYALFCAGKRIRPTLCFITADFCDIPREKVYNLAACIEMIHNYSLIHDDMPCMDNDTYRRGRLTVHKKFGESVALLAGDALLNVSYEILFDLIKTDPIYTESGKIISTYAGTNGMIGGQALELFSDTLDYDTYMHVCKQKTGGLIMASILSVALLSDNPQRISVLSQFGLYLGLIFQITDDLLDKNKNEKASFVTIIGEEKTKFLLNTFVEKAKSVLSVFEDKSSVLVDFCNKIAQRTN